MLQSASIMAFLATKDAARAKAFFQDTLKLRFIADEAFALVFDANGTMLRVSKVNDVVAAPYTVLGRKVADIRLAVKELVGRGIIFERFKGIDQDDLGICAFPLATAVSCSRSPTRGARAVTASC